MRAELHHLLILLMLLSGVHQSAAQQERFFRIVGPAATTITAFNPDGTVVWSNGLANTTYTVQTITSLLDSSNWVPYTQLSVTQAVSTNLLFAFSPPPGMTLIPDGWFTMGDTLDGETDAVPVNVTVSAFYMETNLVSYSLWQSIYAYATNVGYSFERAGSGKAPNHPVQTVYWYDVVKWSNARSQQAGLTPVYYTDAAFTQLYTNGLIEPYVNWSANGYRLPTEAEWEKAARGGLVGLRFPYGNTISSSLANYYADPLSTNNPYGYAYDVSTFVGYNPAFDTGSEPYTSPVGYFGANGYGLCDMAGNVLEWCWDWYGTPSNPAPYGLPTTNNPTGPASGNVRAVRGGSWREDAYGLRCATRDNGGVPYFTENSQGFRCARGL
jgi:sulfatase modifying factor 1